jgi:hypothetical protein
MVIWACADGYLLSLPDAKRGAIPAIVSVPFFLSWLGPMGVVGLGLWAGRLSVISQALNSRRQAVRIASGLTLVGVGLRYWLSTWKVSTHLFSTADWRFAFVVDTIASLLLGAVAVALIVWILPWQRQSRMPHAKE